MSLFPRSSARQYMGYTALIGAMLIAASASSVKAQQPPWEGCRPASKIEYDSAKRDYLLKTRVGTYVRTGHVWRRYYWYWSSIAWSVVQPHPALAFDRLRCPSAYGECDEAALQSRRQAG